MSERKTETFGIAWEGAMEFAAKVCDEMVMAALREQERVGRSPLLDGRRECAMDIALRLRSLRSKPGETP